MRDDFRKETKDELAKRVNYVCSNPNCRRTTLGPKEGERGHVSFGVAAHIAAAAAGGPRYDPSQSADERRSYYNGIWLCQNCAKLIDLEPERYTVGLLREWKSDAEKRARSVLLAENSFEVDDLAFRNVSLTAVPKNVPPFAFALATTEVDNSFFHLHYSDIPFSEDAVWIDCASLLIEVSNQNKELQCSIVGIVTRCEDLAFRPLSGIQFIAQGAYRACEFVIDSEDPYERAMLIEREYGTVKWVDKDFFASGGSVVVESGSSERILLNVLAKAMPRQVRLSLMLELGNETREVPLPAYSTLKVVPTGFVPEGGRRWTIHLDGRANGRGFMQDMLSDFSSI